MNFVAAPDNCRRRRGILTTVGFQPAGQFEDPDAAAFHKAWNGYPDDEDDFDDDELEDEPDYDDDFDDEEYD